MSAKQAYWKPRPTLPDLPQELWLLVFAEAASVPYLLSPDYEPRNFNLNGTRKETHVALAKSMRTRRSLVRVCKAWRAMASEFLYESLFIRHIDGLQCLAEDVIPSVGTYVRRLDVDLDSVSKSFHRQDHSITGIRDDSAVVSTYLRTIIPHIPNLQTAFIHLYCRMSNQYILRHIGDHCSQLKVIQAANIYPHAWNQLFTHCGDIRAVNFLIEGPIRGHDLCLPDNISTLICDGFLSVAWHHIPYPNLTAVSLRLDQPPEFIIEFLANTDMLANVTSLSLTSILMVENTLSAEKIEMLFPAIEQALPKVKHLRLLLPSWMVNTSSSSGAGASRLPKTVKSLDLAARRHQATSGVYTDFFKWLLSSVLSRSGSSIKEADSPEEREVDNIIKVSEHKKGDEPSLLLRFYEEKDIADLVGRHSKVFHRYVEEMRDLGVEVEDHNGLRY